QGRRPVGGPERHASLYFERIARGVAYGRLVVDCRRVLPDEDAQGKRHPAHHGRGGQARFECAIKFSSRNLIRHCYTFLVSWVTRRRNYRLNRNRTAWLRE